MLLSVGLTPAWQQIMVFDSLRVGEVNRASEVSWHVQGKVLNTGIAAHHLGGPTLTLAPLGGAPKREAEKLFDSLGIPRRFIKTKAGTRLCTTLIDRSTGATTELVENGRPMSADELAEFHRAYEEEIVGAGVVVITGSLPEGAAPSYYRDLLEHASCPAILDFRGEGLLAALDLNPYIVKPNREELAQTLGMNLETDEQMLSAMRSLNHRGAAWVVVTDGPRPVWVASQEKLYRFRPITNVKVVNAIGSGDALAAGLAWTTRSGGDIVRAVQFGIAAATENMSQLETCRLDRERVRRLADEVHVEELE